MKVKYTKIKFNRSGIPRIMGQSYYFESALNKGISVLILGDWVTKILFLLSNQERGLMTHVHELHKDIFTVAHINGMIIVCMLLEIHNSFGE